MKFLKDIMYIAPLLVAPIVMAIFSFVSAYVLRFRVPRSGLGFDYVLFCIVVLLGLHLGGVI